MASITLRLTFFESPSHGWLRVKKFNVQSTSAIISPFSYYDERTRDAYLEEDCDAPKFMKAAESIGWKLDIERKYIHDDSFIRDLNNYYC